MKRVLIITVALFFGLWVGNVFAAANDTTTINYEVQAINELNIDDASETLTINAATAGAQPTDATTAGTYDITTNCGTNGKKITAAINTVMPTGVTLSMNVTAPSGGVSAGATTITATAADVVTGIDGVAGADIAIDYTMSATVAAGVVASATKTLTLTLADS